MVRVPAPTNISAGWVVPVLVAVVLASRVQAILLNTELNPDEGQLLAQVMRLAIDPVPWRGVDGTTGGPLNTWFLALFHALGMPLAYAWVHGLAAAMLASIPVFVYATLRQLGGARSAAAAGLAAALTIALSQGANFAHFSSELLPAVVECAVVLLIAVRLARPGRAGLLDLIAALLVGTLPWTKLQSVLGAAVLGLWIVHVGTRAADRAQGAGPGRDW